MFLSILADCFAFLLTLACAYFFQWKVVDIVWGLWITSLIIGYSQILFFAVQKGIDSAKKIHIIAGFAASIFFVGFFTFHFGLFHYVHSVFLNGFFPLPGLESVDGKTSDPNIISLISICLSNYWLLVVAGYFVLLKDSLMTSKTDTRPSTSAKGSPMDSLVIRDVYSSVMRMHFLILLMGFMSTAKLESFALPIVLLFFFFPFKLLKRQTSKTPTDNASDLNNN